MLEGAASGNLCLAASWPGQMRTVWGDHERFFETYFTTYPRPLFHRRRLPPRRGRLLLDHRPRRRRDQRLRPPHRHAPRSKARWSRTPRSPRRRSSAIPHEIKGQAIYAFVTLNAGEEGDDALRKELVQEVRHDIGALAAPEKIQFTPALPKTRSGKIMRRILRKIAEGATERLRRHLDARRPERRRCAAGGPAVSRLAAALAAWLRRQLQPSAAARPDRFLSPAGLSRRRHAQGASSQSAKQIKVDSFGRAEKDGALHPRADEFTRPASRLRTSDWAPAARPGPNRFEGTLSDAAGPGPRRREWRPRPHPLQVTKNNLRLRPDG